MAIFFKADYGKLCESREGGISTVFNHQSALGKISHLFIKRKIPGTDYYDLITPFRYGGPLIQSCKRDNPEALVREFEEDFFEYCRENRIVSEFVRFHPLYNNGADFKSCYQVRQSRRTVGTNLRDCPDPVQREFSKSARRNVRQALEKGVVCKVREKPRDLGRFQLIYYETLRRNNAAPFHYFPTQYFTDCLKLFRKNIVLIEAFYEGKIIAAGLYFACGKAIHVHLSGTLTEFLPLSPAYLLRWAITQWGKSRGYNLIHHGGGLRAGKNDSLFQFKERFGSLRFQFQVGQKIWNPAVYEQLAAAKKERVRRGFPAYR